MTGSFSIYLPSAFHEPQVLENVKSLDSNPGFSTKELEFEIKKFKICKFDKVIRVVPDLIVFFISCRFSTVGV
jgi:hypothetical protein